MKKIGFMLMIQRCFFSDIERERMRGERVEKEKQRSGGEITES